MTTTTTKKSTKAPKITWVKEVPRSRQGRPSAWAVRVEALKERPGVWCDATETYGIGQGSQALAQQHGLEAKTRMVDGVRRLYVRFPEAG